MTRALTAAALVISFTPLAQQAANAEVAPLAAQCSPATLWSVRDDGNLWKYQHNDPANGTYNWAQPSAAVGNGWANARALAAPGGILYAIVHRVPGDGLPWNEGDLVRWRWTGTGWEGQGAVQDQPWVGWHDPAYRNRITIDQNGDFFTDETDGNLHWHRYDPVGKTWEHRIIDSGWDKFDSITAAGDGVLYARTPGGQLFRFQYDAASQRWTQRYKFVGGGWEMFKQIFSPGGDILYGRGASGLDPGSGVVQPVLRWYRYFPDTETWAPGAPDGSGKIVGTGWNTELDITAQPDSCKQDTSVTPQRPAVPTVTGAASTVFQTPDGRLQHFWVDNNHKLVHGDQPDPGTLQMNKTTFTGYQSFTGRSAAAQNADGSLQALALGTDSEIRGDRRTGQVWGPLVSLSGFLAGPPTLAIGPSNVLYAFAVDGQGQLWARPGTGQNGPLTAWRPLGGNNLSATPPTVVRNGANLQVVVLDKNGFYQTATYHPAANPADGTLGPWSGLGGVKSTGPAAAVVALDNQIQVFARSVDGSVASTRQTNGVFTGQWNPIPGLTASGPVSATMSATSRIEIAARGPMGFIHSTGQTAPSSSDFRPWTTVAPTQIATDPVVLSYANQATNQLVFIARDTADQTYVWTMATPTAAITPERSVTATGGKLAIG